MIDPNPPQGPHRRWARNADPAANGIDPAAARRILKASEQALTNCLKAQVHVAGDENFPISSMSGTTFGASPAALAVTPAKGFASVR